MTAWQIRVRGWVPISINEIDETGRRVCLEDGDRGTRDPGRDVGSIDGGDGDRDSVGGTRLGDDLDTQASAIGPGGKGSGSLNSGSSEWVPKGSSRGGSGCAGDMRGSCLCVVLVGGVRVACRESGTLNSLSGYCLCLIN